MMLLQVPLLLMFSVTVISINRMGAAVQAQEIEKVDKFPSGYINGVYMSEAKYKTIDGVLYAVGYEGTKDWILVRNLNPTVH